MAAWLRKDLNFRRILAGSPDAVNRLSPGPGAYGLLIRLPCQFHGEVGALGQVTMPPGTYLYLRSAYGPGGLPARLRRHLRADKRPHWHVDHLKTAGTVVRVFALPNGREGDLVEFARQTLQSMRRLQGLAVRTVAVAPRICSRFRRTVRH